jgi:hypothetical protein
MAWCLVKAQGQLYLLPLPYRDAKLESGPVFVTTLSHEGNVQKTVSRDDNYMCLSVLFIVVVLNVFLCVCVFYGLPSFKFLEQCLEKHSKRQFLGQYFFVLNISRTLDGCF